MLGWRDGSILAVGLGVAWALACSSDFSTGAGGSTGGMPAGGQSAGRSAVAAGFGGVASDAGTRNDGGSPTTIQRYLMEKWGCCDG